MRLACILLILWSLLLTSAPGVVAATDCAQRFVPGAYGVPVTERALRAGLLIVPGFRPIYLEKRWGAGMSMFDGPQTATLTLTLSLKGRGERMT